MGVFNSRVEYGLLAMAVLAERYDGEKLLKAAEIAGEVELPIKYLSQILLDLKRKALVKSETGPCGGYLLMRPPEMISVAEVLNALRTSEEDVLSTDGPYEHALKWLKERFAVVQRDFFSGISLSDLIQEKEANRLGVKKHR